MISRQPQTIHQWVYLMLIITSGGLYLSGSGMLYPVRAETPLIDPLPKALYHPHRLLVRFKPQSAAANRPIEELVPEARIIHTYRFVQNLSVIEVPQDQLNPSLQILHSSEDVLYAEYDYVVHTQAIPNDLLFDQLWGLYNTGQTVNGDPGISGVDIQATTAWDFWIGDPDFRIAVIDTGVDDSHPDLQENIWTNPDEIPNNGLDDDGNGWKDDYHGYNAILDNGDIFDDNGHGTHISGIIGAVGHNGTGVVGVHWRCKFVSVKFLDADGNGFISDAIKAIEYVLDRGIKVSNNSWGCFNCFSQALYDVLSAAQSVDHLFIASSGNGVLGLGVDIDRFPLYPAAFELPNIISVAAVNNNDGKPKFSDFGAQSVDLAAPGANIFSTAVGGGYEFRSGTSMATAYVSGVAAMIMGRRPEFTWPQVRDHILMTTRPVASFQDNTVTGGVLNMLGALGDCNSNDILDEEDIVSGLSKDCNQNGLPDDCEPDCNGNDVADLCDITFGTSLDCDTNHIPDECEPDCNLNGRADACDITDGFSDDCNHNGIPDGCEPRSNADCNHNDTPDICDLYTGVSRDCNHNGIPDECDIESGVSDDCTGNNLPDECERDCNNNGIADSCDIAAGTSMDLDMDHVPDECVLGISLVPIGADMPHIIEDSTIRFVQGTRTFILEIRLSGWDPDQNGTPRLRAYQAGLDPDGLLSGDTGWLSVARVPCINNDDCLAESICEESGFCDAAGGFGIDEFHPNFVFADLPTIMLTDPNTLRMGGLIFDPLDSVIDTGKPKYGGTVTLDISPDATGTFTVGFKLIESFYIDPGGEERSIPLPGLIPATIIISPDCNENRIPDEQDLSEGTSSDCDGDGIPDECVEPIRDCNGNRNPDICDIERGTSMDCNHNNIPDECITLESDCNHNGVPDLCDTLSGFSDDCNGNGIPDECIELELDCNNNNIPDICDIHRGTSYDCNNNDIPDTCEDDCNENGLADECDIASRFSRDRDENGIPDECQRLFLVPEQFPTIQRAIDQAINGDVILISDGVYSGDGNTDIDFHGKSIIVRGENRPENCILDAAGRETVFFLQNGETKNARIENLTVMNARVTGIACVRSSPVIRNCIVTRNGPISSGILCFLDSSPIIENCIITENTAGFSGGGIRSTDRSSPTIINCIIANNSAAEFGGGIFVSGGSPLIVHTRIMHNRAIDGGGGIALRSGQARINNCTISGNSSGSPSLSFLGDGGGVHLINTRATFSGCLITGNDTRHDGGGVYVSQGDPKFINCTIAQNTARSLGGGMFWFDDMDQQIACCDGVSCLDTITAQECLDLAGTIFHRLTCEEVQCGTRACCFPDGTCQNLDFFECLSVDGSPQLPGTQCQNFDCHPPVSNSILWGNFAITGNQIYAGTINLNVTHSTVQGGWPGDDNSLLDPKFVEPGYWDKNNIWLDGDYHLMTVSASINSGRNDRISSEFVDDRDGHPRILCRQIDRGAYEFGIGDYNCDFRVDLIDFQRWNTCMTGVHGNPSPEGCQAFDFNADADVDLLDYAAFQIRIGQQLP